MLYLLGVGAPREPEIEKANMRLLLTSMHIGGTGQKSAPDRQSLDGCKSHCGTDGRRTDMVPVRCSSPPRNDYAASLTMRARSAPQNEVLPKGGGRYMYAWTNPRGGCLFCTSHLHALGFSMWVGTTVGSGFAMQWFFLAFRFAANNSCSGTTIIVVAQTTR